MQVTKSEFSQVFSLPVPHAVFLLGHYWAQQISFSFITLFDASTEYTLHWCFLLEYKYVMFAVFYIDHIFYRGFYLFVLFFCILRGVVKFAVHT